jgi:Tfp pilus assembly protein PilO
MDKSFKSLSVLILIAVILGLGYFGVYGQWGKLGDARAAFDISKKQNEELKQAREQLTTFLAEYERNKDKAALADRALPKGTPGIPYLLDLYSKVVVESGLNLTSLNITDSADDNTDAAPQSIQVLDLDFDVTGTYEAYKEFLLRVQRNLRISDIISMNVTGADGATDTGTLKFTLSLRTYYQK